MNKPLNLSSDLEECEALAADLEAKIERLRAHTAHHPKLIKQDIMIRHAKEKVAHAKFGLRAARSV